jgi:hypothetical protein
LENWIKRKIQQSVVYKRPISLTEKKTLACGERLEEDLPSQWLLKTGRSNNTYFRQSRLQTYNDQTK